MSVPFFPHIRKLFTWKYYNHWVDNSVIVITGATSGIGKEIALQYSTRNCRLVLAARNLPALEEVVAQCSKGSCSAIGVATDVTSSEQCKRLIETAMTSFGSIDILILVAGVGCHNVFANTEDFSIFQKLLQINFFGYLYLTACAFPYLAESHGSLVAITGPAGEMGLPFRTAYCASKFAITGFFEALRAELEMTKPIGRSEPVFNITICVPPAVDTNFRKNSLTTDPHLRNISNPKRSLTAEKAASVIIDATDRKLRKVYFPFSSFIGVYFRPFFPDIVDFFAMQRSKL